MDIDYALSVDFVDDDGKPYQMRFRYGAPETGQLIGIITKDRPDAGRIVAISRPGVPFDDVATALADWRDWAQLTDDTVDLSAIRQRIVEAGLGCEESDGGASSSEQNGSWQSEIDDSELCPIFPVRYC